ncbi:unnamed protein product [Arctia plantaginis]|uniref:Uncharacterized protein n=1 Tax=Arctia plantaginis TaxID=874455 RepID=A0A8S0ZS54_ARCPL|nr:unnamed protein product [Arctia plantaginis]CAB3236060.1 unnamed protein product [Arctia plantaginis]
MQPLFANDVKTKPCRAAHGNIPRDTALHFESKDLTLDIGSWHYAIRLSPVNGRPPPAPLRPLFATIQQLYNAHFCQQ